MTKPAGETSPIRSMPSRPPAGSTADALRRRLVEQHDIAVAESAGAGKFHRQLSLDAFEHGPAVADDDRVEHDLVFVDQSGLRQLRDDASAPHHHDVRTGLLLQLADLSR